MTSYFLMRSTQFIELSCPSLFLVDDTRRSTAADSRGRRRTDTFCCQYLESLPSCYGVKLYRAAMRCSPPTPTLKQAGQIRSYDLRYSRRRGDIHFAFRERSRSRQKPNENDRHLFSIIDFGMHAKYKRPKSALPSFTIFIGISLLSLARSAISMHHYFRPLLSAT